MAKKLRRLGRTLAIVLALAFVGIQFVPVDRSNPEVIEPFEGDPQLLTVLKRSCWDCHSNETVWPWYSYVAPFSWFVADHVLEGREKLNFSDWDESDIDDVREEAWKEVRKDRMPLPSYLWLHSDAKLSAADKAVFENWAKD